MARLGVRGTFSQPGPSHPAASGRLTRTLGRMATLVPPDLQTHARNTAINPEQRMKQREFKELIHNDLGAFLQERGYVDVSPRRPFAQFFREPEANWTNGSLDVEFRASFVPGEGYGIGLRRVGTHARGYPAGGVLCFVKGLSLNEYMEKSLYLSELKKHWERVEGVLLSEAGQLIREYEAWERASIAAQR